MRNRLNIFRTLTTAMAIFAATWVMSASATAGPGEFHKFIERPGMYDMLPDLWDLLSTEGALEWVDQDEATMEPNGDLDHAFTISDGMLINGHVDNSSDQNDFFKVVLSSPPKSVFLELSWAGSAWLNFYTYDENLQPVTYDNETSVSPKVLSIWQGSSTVYYIRVKAAYGVSDYKLKVSVAGQIGELQNDALADTDLVVSAFADPLVSVICSSADPTDYAIVSIPSGCESATISLDWFGTTDANLDFAIYGPGGAELMSAANSNSFESLYSQNVPAGDYYIAVKAVAGRAMYKLMVDAEVDLKIHLPHFEMEVAPWFPPFPFNPAGDLLLLEQPAAIIGDSG